jgi:hypothetical protein
MSAPKDPWASIDQGSEGPELSLYTEWDVVGVDDSRDVAPRTLPRA